MTRKIIQICARPEGSDTYAALFALCDDGSLWGTFASGVSWEKGWQRMDPIPQDSPAARRKP